MMKVEMARYTIIPQFKDWALEMLNKYNDREIKELKDSAKPVKMSGWTIGEFALSAVVGLGSLLDLAITLITVIK